MLAGKSEKEIAEVKSALAKLFQVKDMGEMHCFLGVSVKQNPKTGETWVGQPQTILKIFGMVAHPHTCGSKHKTIEDYR